MPDKAVETAQAIAHHYKAGFVLLDAERQIARVVFAQTTVDFARQVGPSLTSDLQRRDFTVNAIAYSPHNQMIVDPLQGCRDLAQGIIRMVSPQNLAADPLRLLRAYRQAAQLNFSLDPDTQREIRQLAPQLSQVAAERVRVEIGYLLAHRAGTPWLKTAWEDGLLREWFPAASPRGLAKIVAMDQAAARLTQSWPELKAHLNGVDQRPCQGATVHRPKLATAKLIGLLAPDPQDAAATLWRLKYSRAEIHLVTLLLQWSSPALPFSATLPRQDQYFMYKKLGQAFPLLAVIAVAEGTEAMTPLIERFLTPDDPIAHPRPLVTGQDLIDALGLCPGPQIGKLLGVLERAQAAGDISTPAEALDLARHITPLNDADPPR